MSRPNDMKINYPLLIGNGRQDFQDAYGPFWGIPVTVFVDRDGRIHKKHSGIASKEQFAHEIDDDGEHLLLTQRNLNRRDLTGAIAVQRFQGAVQACALPVQLVHDDDAWQVQRGCFAPQLTPRKAGGS